MKILANDYPIEHWRRIAASNGIASKTFEYRLKKYPPNVAATMPKQKEGPTGKPGSPRQVALAAGLRENAISAYRRRNPNTPLTNEQIAAHLVERQRRLDNGETLNAKAKAAGLCLTTVQKRMKRGLTLQQALSLPAATPAEAARLALAARRRNRAIRRQQNNASVK